MTAIPVLDGNPSSSLRNADLLASCISESRSSRTTTHGADRLACAKTLLILTSSESSSDFTLLTYRQGRPSLFTSALMVQVLPLPGGPVSNSPRFQGMEYRSYTSLAAKNRVRSSR